MFSKAALRAMASIYRTDTPLSVDQLPYTQDFERMYKTFTGRGFEATKQDFWKGLTNLRKKGSLERKQKPLAKVGPAPDSYRPLLKKSPTKAKRKAIKA